MMFPVSFFLIKYAVSIIVVILCPAVCLAFILFPIYSGDVGTTYCGSVLLLFHSILSFSISLTLTTSQVLSTINSTSQTHPQPVYFHLSCYYSGPKHYHLFPGLMQPLCNLSCPFYNTLLYYILTLWP